MVRSAERACPDHASHRRENHEGQVLARGHPSRRPPLAGGPRFSNLLGSSSKTSRHRGRSPIEHPVALIWKRDSSHWHAFPTNWHQITSTHGSGSPHAAAVLE